MSKVKKILSLLLVAALVLTIAPTSVLASADYINGAVTTDPVISKTDFTVSASATEVVRVAYSQGSFTLGTTIVAATPSGVPQSDSGSCIATAYAGETPEWPKVTFSIQGLEPDSVPSVASSLGSNLSLTSGKKTTSGDTSTYTWSVTGGTASAGDNIVFTITYSVGSTQYTSYAYSHVENILNSPGAGVNKKRDGAATDGGVCRQAFLALIQSKNMYAGALSEADTHGFVNYASTTAGTSGGAYSGMGSENTISGSGGNDASAFLSCVPNTNIPGTQQAVVFKSSKTGNSTANYNAGWDNDENRANATIYLDTSRDTLTSLNMRMTIGSYEGSNWYEMHLTGLACLDYIWVGSVEGDYSASNLSSSADSSIFASSYDTNDYIRTVGDWRMSTFSGTGAPTNRDTTNGNTLAYSIVPSVHSDNGSSKGRWTQSAVGINVTFISYDKSQLRAVINGVLGGDGTTYSATFTNSSVTFNKGKNPQARMYTSGWDNFVSAFGAANIVLATPDTSQSAINTATTDLITAYNGLTGYIATVNYTIMHVAQGTTDELVEAQTGSAASGSVMLSYPATIPGYGKVGSESVKSTNLTGETEDVTVTWYYAPLNKTVAAFTNNDTLGDNQNKFYTTAVGSIFETSTATADVGTKEFYEFEGWYYDNVTFEQPVPSSFTMPNEYVSIFGKWITAPIKIYCDTQIDGHSTELLGQIRPDENYPVAFARPADLNIPGYLFVDYYADAAFTTVQTWPMLFNLGDTDTTIYARMVDVNGKVIFESNGGSAVSDIAFTAGDSISAPEDPTRTGYTFAGWYYDRDLTSPVSWPVATSDSTSFIAYAKWTANDITIRFNTDVGLTPSKFDTAEIAPITGPADSVIPEDQWPAEPQRFGYVFSHWVISGTTTRFFEEGETYNYPTSNMTLKAVWRAIDTSTYIEVDAYQKILGEYVEADTAKNGDIITVRMTVTSNYYAGSSAYILMYDNTFFEPIASGASAIKLNENNNYVSGIDAQYSVVDSVPANVWPAGLDNTNYTAIQVAIDPTISATNYKVAPLDGNDYLIEVQFRVKDTATGSGTIYMDNAWTRSEDNLTGPQFIGWSNDANTVVIDTYNNKVIPNLDYATATVVIDEEPPVETTIYADANGGVYSDDSTEIKTYTGRVGTEILDYDAPVKAGYTLTEWVESIDGEQTWVEGYYGSDENDGLTFVAQWTANDYVANFYNDTVDGTLYYTTTAGYETEVAGPVLNPTKTGYEFAGWVDSEGTEYEVPFIMPLDGINLYANWTPGQVTYKIAANYLNPLTGNNAVVNTSKTGTTGYTVMIVETVPDDPDPETIYYTIADLPTIIGGNYIYDETNNTLPITAVIAADGTTVVNVNYIAKPMVATYNANGGKFADDSTTKVENTRFQYILEGPGEEPTREGYDFAGWQNVTLGTTRITRDSTYNATWTAKTFDAVFMNGEEEFGVVSVAYGSAVTAPEGTPAKTGYTFLGWATTAGATQPEALGTMDSVDGKIYYAVFVLTEYTVEYYVDEELVYTDVYTMGQDVTIRADETRTGYTFSGWMIADAQAADFTMPADDVTITGSFTANTYNVIFNANGGTYVDGTTKEVAVTFDSAITAPEEEPTKAGYSFLGYAAAQDSETVITSFGDLTTVDTVTYYAVWEANEATYYVDIFVADTTGAYPATAESTVELTGTVDTEVSYTPEARDGFTVDATSVLTGTVPATDELRLVVKYSRNQYDFITNVDGVETTTQYYYEAEIEAPADPEKPGYTFNSWTPAVPDTMPLNGITVTATWTVNKYSVIFYTDTDASTVEYQGEADFGSVIVEAGSPIKVGYTFRGWADKATGDEVEFTATTPTVPVGGMEFIPVWEINTHNITYRTYNGVYATISGVEYGTAVSDFPRPENNPTRPGYTFTGWNFGSYTTMPDSDITVTATWSHDEYTVTFADTGDNEVEPVTAYYGNDVADIILDAFPDDPTKEGYTFIGWDDYPATMPESNITITALWEINQYTITFNTNGGSAIEAITQDYGTAVTAPADPTRVGYDFNGWDTEIPATMPAEDLTITAQWTIRQHTLTFDTDGGNEIAPITQNYGTAVTAPANPTKTGYTFLGWTDGEGTQISVPATMPDEDITFVASWSINQYTITFNTDGGSAIEAITQDYGTAVTAPADPTKTGYTFAGWDAEVPATMPANDVTLTAQWNVNQYTITFDTDGGSAIEAVTQDYGTAVTAPADPTKTGYTFVGWDAEIPATMPADNKTITAVWTVNQYTISFNTDGGSTIEAITQDYGTDVTAPADPTKTGYTFVKWVDGEGNEATVPATMPANNVALTAVWQINQYTISFDTDGGSAIEAITQNYGTDVTAPADPTKEGYTFIKWVDGEGNEATVPATMPANDVELYAEWEVNNYEVKFLAFDGSEFYSYSAAYGTAITAPASNPEQQYYNFIGWSLDGTTVADDLGTIPVDGITITPIFERVTVTLVTSDESTAIINKEIAQPPVTGYIYGLEERLRVADLLNDYIEVQGDGRIVVTPVKFNLCGTGTKVEVYDNVEDVCVETYYIIIFGDVNGDSYINATDAAVIADEVNLVTCWSIEDEENDQYDYCKVLAADVAPNMPDNTTDGLIKLADANAVREVVLLQGEISQTEGCYVGY